MRFHDRRKRFFILPVVIVIALLIAGIGVYAGFTSSTNAVTHTFSTGTLTLDVGATGGQSNRLDVDATDETPGDSVQRSVDLVNSGSVDLSSITLTTTASPSSILDTDTTDGLQFTIDRCSTSWTESGTSPNFTYTCPGSTDSVLAVATGDRVEPLARQPDRGRRRQYRPPGGHLHAAIDRRQLVRGQDLGHPARLHRPLIRLKSQTS